MRFLFYNLVAICLIVLAGLLAYWDKSGWYWCVVAAVLVTVVPDKTRSESSRAFNQESKTTGPGACPTSLGACPHAPAQPTQNQS